jgi:hypothetical protein
MLRPDSEAELRAAVVRGGTPSGGLLGRTVGTQFAWTEWQLSAHAAHIGCSRMADYSAVGTSLRKRKRGAYLAGWLAHWLPTRRTGRRRRKYSRGGPNCNGAAARTWSAGPEVTTTDYGNCTRLLGALMGGDHRAPRAAYGPGAPEPFPVQTNQVSACPAPIGFTSRT